MNEGDIKNSSPLPRFLPSADLVTLIVAEQADGGKRLCIACDSSPHSPWGILTAEIGERVRHHIASVAYHWIHEGRSPEMLACRLPSGTWRWRDPDLRRDLAHSLNLPSNHAVDVLINLAQEIWDNTRENPWNGAWGRLEAQEKGLWLTPGQRKKLINFPSR